MVTERGHPEEIFNSPPDQERDEVVAGKQALKVLAQHEIAATHANRKTNSVTTRQTLDYYTKHDAQ